MKKPFSRDLIKLTAIIAMTLCHISVIFLEPSAGADLMRALASYTAAAMCWFVVEGVRKSKDLAAYGKRLAGFALISQVPYCLAFTKDQVITWQGMNMIYTLLMIFMMALFMQTEADRKWRIVLTMAAAAASLAGDWAGYAALFGLLFIWAGEDKNRQILSFLISFLIHFAAVFCHRMLFGAGIGPAAGEAFIQGAGIMLAGLMIVFLYNGKRWRHASFWKWFFYIYYPLHLTILGIIRLIST